MKHLQHRRGFSLIELMVVISIVALIAGVVVASFSGGIRVWESASMLTSIEQEAYFGAENIRHDLANTFEFNGLSFHGEKDYISFPGLVSVVDEEGQTRYRIGTVKYFHDQAGRTITRLTWPYPDVEDNADVEIIAEDVASLRFAYLKPWADSSRDWTGSWQSSSNFPAAVSMELSVTNRKDNLVVSREIPLTEGLWQDD